MKIAIALFDRFTALDAIGPYEVLSRLPGAEVVFVGASRPHDPHRHAEARPSSPTPPSTTCPRPTSWWCPADRGTRAP